MSSFKITGLKEFQKKLEKSIDEASGSVSFEELFDHGFMEKHSDFKTIGELLEHHGIQVNSQEEFEALDDDVLDKAITSSSDFGSWSELYKDAAQELIKKRMTEQGFTFK